MSASPAPDQMDTDVQGDEEYMEQKIINEEYKVWKKNSVFLYDMMFSRALEWPTLTTQWFPDKKEVPGTNYSQHRLLFGTHTSGQAQNYIQIASIEIPDLAVPDPADYDENRGEIGGYGSAKKPFSFNVIQKINHPSEVNKARYQPQNPHIIASLCTDGRVLIFDKAKHPMNPKENQYQFEMELHGHTQEGYGLNWSPLIEGQLVTGMEDATVRLWDIVGGYSKSNNVIQPVKTYNHHSATVNDVQHHPVHSYWIGSVSDDNTFQVLDTRNKDNEHAVYKEEAHSDAVQCLAWHPRFETIVATGSADKTVALWDLRNLKTKLHVLESHKDSVMSLEWHVSNDAVLASSSYDRRILMWDISKIGEEQTAEEADDGPPELLFMHGGFTNRVVDFSWNRNEPWVMLAAAEDNQLQVFRPARSLVNTSRKKVQNQEVSD